MLKSYTRGRLALCTRSPPSDLPRELVPSTSHPYILTRILASGQGASWGWATVGTAQRLLQAVPSQPAQRAAPLDPWVFRIRRAEAWKGPWRPNSPSLHFMEEALAGQVGKGLATSPGSGKGLAHLPWIRAMPAPLLAADRLSVGRPTLLGAFAPTVFSLYP